MTRLPDSAFKEDRRTAGTKFESELVISGPQGPILDVRHIASDPVLSSVDLGPTGRTELSRFRVDILYIRRDVHDAVKRQAVHQPVQVSELVEGFFGETRVEKIGVGCEAIELILKPVIGDNPDPTVELRFPENEGQDGDAEVIASYCEEARVLLVWIQDRGGDCGEVRDDTRGVVLQPLFIEEWREIQFHLPETHVGPKHFPEWTAERGHLAAVRMTEGEKEDRLHGERFRPYFSILW